MKTNKAVIDKLFYRMKTKYGSKWILLIGHDVPATKSLWLGALKMITAEHIGRAIELIQQSYPVEPPTHDEFKIFIDNMKKQKLGHLSDKLWESPVMEKCEQSTGNKYLDDIKSAGYLSTEEGEDTCKPKA